MKLLALFEEGPSVKSRLLKLQQALIDSCDDVSELAKIDIPFEPVTHGITHWTRYGFLVKAEHILHDALLLILLDADPRCHENTITISVLQSPSLPIDDHEELVATAMMLRHHSGFRYIWGYDEPMEYSQGIKYKGVDELIAWFARRS